MPVNPWPTIYSLFSVEEAATGGGKRDFAPDADLSQQLAVTSWVEQLARLHF